VEAFAAIIVCRSMAEKGVRKEHHVLPGNAAWPGTTPTASTSSSRAGAGAELRISVPKYPPRIQITASRPANAAASRTTTSTSRRNPGPDGDSGRHRSFAFQTTYYLNGHSFIEQELKRAQVGFRKTDNAFLAVDDVAALAAAADKLSPQSSPTLDYWTLILGPKFSAKERKQLNLSRLRDRPD